MCRKKSTDRKMKGRRITTRPEYHNWSSSRRWSRPNVMRLKSKTRPAYHSVDSFSPYPAIFQFEKLNQQAAIEANRDLLVPGLSQVVVWCRWTDGRSRKNLSIHRFVKWPGPNKWFQVDGATRFWSQSVAHWLDTRVRQRSRYSKRFNHLSLIKRFGTVPNSIEILSILDQIKNKTTKTKR
jgi:hypothetical protein